MLHHEAEPQSTPSARLREPIEIQLQDDINAVLIKNDRVYSHQLVRINYTTYDVRRAQDVINPRTTHRNIMLLAQEDLDTDIAAEQLKCHPFLYARVLGIYHVNVVYVGSGMLDYNARRLDFLWVRWYQRTETRDAMSWTTYHLDQLSFPPMANQDAFGFVDPADVLRSCHVIPRFAKGKRYSDNIGLSKCTRDSGDWKFYYLGR
jgi:hypothetical protein